MQIESLQFKSYRIWKVDEVSGSVARKRLECLEWVDEMRAECCSGALCLRATGWSRVTYYRWRRGYRQRGAGVGEWFSAATSSSPALLDGGAGAGIGVEGSGAAVGQRQDRGGATARCGGFELSDSTVGRILRRAMARARIR